MCPCEWLELVASPSLVANMREERKRDGDKATIELWLHGRIEESSKALGLIPKQIKCTNTILNPTQRQTKLSSHQQNSSLVWSKG